jgi:hypothetical protein
MKLKNIFTIFLNVLLSIWAFYQINVLPKGFQQIVLILLLVGFIYTILANIYSIKPPFGKSNKDH